MSARTIINDGSEVELFTATNPAAVYIENDGGANPTPAHTVATVTTASAIALAANTSRKYALLVNDSDTIIYIKFGTAAVANQGVRLNASGGSYEMSNMFGNLFTGAVYAIHAGTGDKTLLITEGT